VSSVAAHGNSAVDSGQIVTLSKGIASSIVTNGSFVLLCREPAATSHGMLSALYASEVHYEERIERL
jgi:hypothetical protein